MQPNIESQIFLECLPVCWIDGEFGKFSVYNFMLIVKRCFGDGWVWASSSYQVIFPAENSFYMKFNIDQ